MEEILHHRKDGRNLTSNRMDHLSRRLLREWLVRQPTEPGAHEGFPSQVRRGQVHLAAGISWWFTYGLMGNPGSSSWFHGDLIGFSGIQWDFMVSWWDSMDMCNAFLGGFHRFVLMGIVDIQWKLFDAMYWYLIAFFRVNGDFMLAGEKPLDTLKSPNLQSSTLDSPGCFGTVVPLLSIKHQRNPTVDI